MILGSLEPLSRKNWGINPSRYALAQWQLTKITIPSTVNKILYRAYYRCSNLEVVHISDGVKVISKSAFRYCPKLSKVYLPKSINYVDTDAFSQVNGFDLYVDMTREDWYPIAKESNRLLGDENIRLHFVDEE